MAWRFVRQPNGKLAVFSEVVDGFTAADMDTDEAIDYAIGKGLDHKAAHEKVQWGIDDGPTLRDAN